MIILGIETSCDETALALVEASGGLHTPRFKILKNLVASQIKIHAPYGGVVPNLAKREHLKNLPILFKKLLSSKSYSLSSIDLIAVTVGPGLEPALWTGINFAKELAGELNVPVVGANHLEGHLYSFLLPQKSVMRHVSSVKNIFPAIALIVSGGHTILLKMDSLTKWKRLGETRDDAVGEAFDKVARLLGLPYPGGPEIEKIARRGNPDATIFPRPMMYDKSYDFSFSGLKTSVFYYLRDNDICIHELNPHTSATAADIAASFQKAAVDVLIHKTLRAAKEFSAKGACPSIRRGPASGGNIKSIMLSGGVAANKTLRKEFGIVSRRLKVNFLAAPMKFNTDNAAMIAVAGYMAYLRGKRYKFSAQGNLNI